jgi:hypothetical protein
MKGRDLHSPTLRSGRVAVWRGFGAWTVTLPLVALLLAGCDPEGKKQCSWVLEPEPKLDGTADPGYIPVCARNRTTMKEDCRLQTTVEYAKKVLERKFRYVDLRYARPGLPRTITEIKFCDGKEQP